MEFEKNISDLKSIVDTLENGNLSFDEALDLYKKGQNLVIESEKELASLKSKITMLNNDFSLMEDNTDD